MTACNNETDHTTTQSITKTAPVPGTFAFDTAFIHQHDSSAIILKSGPAQILVSSKYQGKVFTSTSGGDTGRSFGWIHYKAFEGPLDPHMNGYGGENRLWLGPEGGPFSLFFAPGTQMEFTNWHTPAGFDSEPWTLATRTATSATLTKALRVTNYAGTQLSIGIDRTVRLLDPSAISTWLRAQLPTGIEAVAYMTENTLTNAGTTAWTEQTGMPCLWLLDMFPPSDSTTIVIPYMTKDNGQNNLPATTNYFGEIGNDRIKYQDSTLFYKADGKQRGKLGMHPDRTRPVAGSYDATHHILSIIRFDTDPLGRYLNQEWRTDKPPFSGDAMNAYNDGPLADGSQMGPFYELESVSSAAFLPPGHSITHRHAVFHFTGAQSALDQIAKQVLGVSLDQINSVFK